MHGLPRLAAGRGGFGGGRAATPTTATGPAAGDGGGEEEGRGGRGAVTHVTVTSGRHGAVPHLRPKRRRDRVDGGCRVVARRPAACRAGAVLRLRGRVGVVGRTRAGLGALHETELTRRPGTRSGSGLDSTCSARRRAEPRRAMLSAGRTMPPPPAPCPAPPRRVASTPRELEPGAARDR